MLSNEFYKLEGLVNCMHFTVSILPLSLLHPLNTLLLSLPPLDYKFLLSYSYFSFIEFLIFFTYSDLYYIKRDLNRVIGMKQAGFH